MKERSDKRRGRSYTTFRRKWARLVAPDDRSYNTGVSTSIATSCAHSTLDGIGDRCRSRIPQRQPIAIRIRLDGISIKLFFWSRVRKFNPRSEANTGDRSKFVGGGCVQDIAQRHRR